MTERQAGAEGLGEIGGDSNKVRVRLQSGGNVLQGGGTDSATILIGDLGPVGGNIGNCGRETHYVSEKITGKRSWRKTDRM